MTICTRMYVKLKESVPATVSYGTVSDIACKINMKRRVGHRNERNKKASISYPASSHKQTRNVLFHSLQNTIFQ